MNEIIVLLSTGGSTESVWGGGRANVKSTQICENSSDFAS